MAQAPTRSVHQCSSISFHLSSISEERCGAIGASGPAGTGDEGGNGWDEFGMRDEKQQLQEVMKDEFALDAIEILAAPPKKKTVYPFAMIWAVHLFFQLMALLV